MTESEPIIALGRTYQRAFDQLSPAAMPRANSEDYANWLTNNPGYTPTFSDRLGSALDWAETNPRAFEDMIYELNEAIELLDDPTFENYDPEIFPNLAEYRCSRQEDKYLPLVLPSAGLEPTNERAYNKFTLLRAAIDAARCMRLGETTRPEGADFYSFHKFMNSSDQAMAGASLFDLYEIYAKTLGTYPTDSKIDGVVAAALTEAAFIINPASELFKAVNDPSDGWTEGYEAFTKKFQDLANPKVFRAGPNQVAKFERPGFSGKTRIPKEAKLGFTILEISVRGKHPLKRMGENTTRTYQVTSGHGSFTMGDEAHTKTYSARKGDIFVIKPGGTYSYSGKKMTLLETNISPDNSFTDEEL